MIDDRGFLLSSFVLPEVSLETSSVRKRNQIEIPAVSGDNRDNMTAVLISGLDTRNLHDRWQGIAKDRISIEGVVESVRSQ